MAWPNGRVPKELLIKDGEHYFFPGTHRRFLRLRERLEDLTGVRIFVTWGPNAYRDYDEQVAARAEHGIMASLPGKSSHGGLWSGNVSVHGQRAYGLPAYVYEKETGALDIWNYNEGIPWEVFQREAEAAGFLVNVTVPEERWHIVDPNPWVIPAYDEIEEDEMTEDDRKKLNAIYDALYKDGKTAKDWSLLHKVDWIRRQWADAGIDSPGGPNPKWTVAHILSWLSRTMTDVLDRVKKIESKIK